MKNIHHLLKSFLMTSVLAMSFTACGEGRILGPGVSAQTSDFGSIQNQEAVPGEYIIKRNGKGYLSSTIKAGETGLSPQAQFAQDHGMEFIKEIPNSGLELFKVSNPAILDQLTDLIEYAEPNYLRHLSLPEQSALNSQSTFQRQTADNVDLPADNNYIGIIDTGVDEENPALQGRLVTGINTLGSESLYDDNGHGTFLAGIAVGEDASQQIDGLLQGGKVLPIKALDANGIGTDFSIAEGIYAAIEYGAKVIVLSASGAKQGQALTQAIDFANQNNVPIIVPASNQLNAASAFPASSRGVISVNAVDIRGQNVTSYASSPGRVSISAVAEGIRSTLPTRGFSMQRQGVNAGAGQMQTPAAAAMQVAAAVASIKTTNPGINLSSLYQKLSAATDDLGQRGEDNLYGSGRLNIARVKAASSQPVQRASVNAQRAQQQVYPQSSYPQQQSAYPQQASYNAYNNQQQRR